MELVFLAARWVIGALLVLLIIWRLCDHEDRIRDIERIQSQNGGGDG